jgi:hypothetical protein
MAHGAWPRFGGNSSAGEAGKLPTSPADFLCFSVRATRASGIDCGIGLPIKPGISAREAR